MKKTFLILLFGASFLKVFSQDTEKKTKLYLSNNNGISGKLVSVPDEGKIEFSISNGGIRIYERERLLMAFNEYGRYLIVSSLSSDVEKSRKEIDDFYNMQTAPLSNDVIFKAVPFEIIPCTITYNKDAINYKTLDGNSASINKDNILAIINRDGTHEIVRDVTEIAPILGSNVEKFKQATTPIAVVAPKPVVKPEPKPVQVEPIATQSTIPAIDISAKPKLTEAEKKDYSNQSIDNILVFKDYLNRIGDKKRSQAEKRQDVKDALELFSPGATIEVTSKNKAGTRKLPVDKYLNNLSNLNYSSIKIDYANLRFVNELNQAPDGNYYGIVRGEQSFMGFGADGKTPIYSDVVDKNYKVKLESYNKINSGQKEAKWKILLGDVSVSQ